MLIHQVGEALDLKSLPNRLLHEDATGVLVVPVLDQSHETTTLPARQMADR